MIFLRPLHPRQVKESIVNSQPVSLPQRPCNHIQPYSGPLDFAESRSSRPARYQDRQPLCAFFTGRHHCCPLSAHTPASSGGRRRGPEIPSRSGTWRAVPCRPLYRLRTDRKEQIREEVGRQLGDVLEKAPDAFSNPRGNTTPIGGCLGI